MSRFFSNSRSSSPVPPPHSPLLRDQLPLLRDPLVDHDDVPELQPFSSRGHSPQPSSVSSHLTSLMEKTSSVFDKVKIDMPRSWNNLSPMPLASLSVTWRRKNKTSTPKKSVGASNGCSDVDFTNETEETVVTSNGNQEHVPARNTNSEILVEETSVSDSSKDFLSNLVDESTFISSNLFEFLQSSLPNLVKGCQWVLLYSTLKHGISFRTLVRKSADIPGPCLLIAGDKQGAIFGGLLEGPLRTTANRKYQGTSQTFLFTTVYGAPRLFRATGANRFYYMCLSDFLAFGGGGDFALRLEEDLLHGRSGHSDTFGNLCLAHSPEFELKNVELWGFAHISRYLNSGY